MVAPKVAVRGDVRAHPKKSTAKHKPPQMPNRSPRPPQSPKSSNAKTQPAPQSPQPAASGHALLSLLEIEREAREAESLTDLHYIIANQTPKLTAARQAFVFKTSRRKKMKLCAVTGLVTVDRTVPMIHAFERLAASITGNQGGNAPRLFETDALHQDYAELKTNYPFHAMCWIPLVTRGDDVFAGILLAREKSWSEADVVVAARLGGAFQHAWSALVAKPRANKPRSPFHWLYWLALVSMLFALAIPVPMTTLAPMEIVPSDPFIVAAPIDGVVRKISIEPNAKVAEGDTLVAFENTTLNNQLELAEREVLVATARLKRATQLAFFDPRGRHELGIARAELELKTAERDFARDLAANATIIAERAGIAIFSDKNQLLGKPLAVGERIMQIANPANVEVRIDIPVGDSLILSEGAPVTLYLDSAPLAPVSATITQADFEAKKTASDTVAFKAVATIDDHDRKPPRLGVRGTAQIFGQKVPLGFYLFRKPIAALRQWIGL